MTKPFFKFVSWYLIFALFVFGFTPEAFAALIPSENTGLSSIDRSMNFQKIQKVIESKMVKKRLEALGFSQEEIQIKLGRLDGNQMHLLAQNLDGLKVGAGGFEVIVVMLLVAIVGLIWLHIYNKKITIQNQ
jgi:hypothetical protein